MNHYLQQILWLKIILIFMKNNKNELISVIIPCYNSEKTINRAIDSVINQSYKNLEILVIDDGSTDNTRNIINNYIKNDTRIKYFYLDNSGGPSLPSNFGVDKSEGEFVAFLDHDDEWALNKLERQLNLIKSDQIDFVSCFTYFVNTITGFSDRVIIKKYLNYKNIILEKNFILSLSSILMKKKVFCDIGGFDERLKGIQDWDLYIRLFVKGYQFGFIDNYLLYNYKQENSLSLKFSEDKFIKETSIIYKKNEEFYSSKKIKSNYLKSLGVTCQSFGHYSLSRYFFKKSIGVNNFNFFSYFLFILSFLKRDIFNYLLKLKVKFNFLVEKFHL
jgi:glycosyltransferase involved in cell wall biosynthesis